MRNVNTEINTDIQSYIQHDHLFTISGMIHCLCRTVAIARVND